MEPRKIILECDCGKRGEYKDFNAEHDFRCPECGGYNIWEPDGQKVAC